MLRDKVSAVVVLGKLIFFFRHTQGLGADDTIVQHLMQARNDIDISAEEEGALRRTSRSTSSGSFSENVYDFLGQFFEEEGDYQVRMKEKALKALKEVVPTFQPDAEEVERFDEPAFLRAAADLLESAGRKGIVAISEPLPPPAPIVWEDPSAEFDELSDWYGRYQPSADSIRETIKVYDQEKETKWKA